MFFWAASAMAGLTWIVHTFVGGRAVARPLLADTTLPPAARWLSYYCWHITTVVIGFIAAAFAWLAATASAPAEIGLFLAALTASLSLLSAGVALKAGIHPLRLPSTSLFAATSVLAAAEFLSRIGT